MARESGPRGSLGLDFLYTYMHLPAQHTHKLYMYQHVKCEYTMLSNGSIPQPAPAFPSALAGPGATPSLATARSPPGQEQKKETP